MADDLREQLLASYPDMGQAMVVQSVLEAEGIPCRVADLGELPSHVLGMPGGMRRSVGLWVLGVNAERAAALLTTLGSPEASVDEAALADEALAAPQQGERSAEPEPARPRGGRLATERAVSPWLGAVVILVILATLAAARGCG